MEKKRKIVFLCLTILCLNFNTVFAKGKNDVRSANSINWNPVIEAIIAVESNGNPKAKSGQSVGAMQITPVLVVECNRILKKRKSKKRYTLSDRLSISKSKEMFLLFQSHYNPKNCIEQAIRSWNGGMNYTIKGTQRYFKKVMKAMK